MLEDVVHGFSLTVPDGLYAVSSGEVEAFERRVLSRGVEVDWRYAHILTPSGRFDDLPRVLIRRSPLTEAVSDPKQLRDAIIASDNAVSDDEMSRLTESRVAAVPSLDYQLDEDRGVLFITGKPVDLGDELQWVGTALMMGRDQIVMIDVISGASRQTMEDIRSLLSAGFRWDQGRGLVEWEGNADAPLSLSSYEVDAEPLGGDYGVESVLVVGVLALGVGLCFGVAVGFGIGRRVGGKAVERRASLAASSV